MPLKTKAKKRKNQDAQEETRFRVAEYLRKKLGTQKQAAEIFGITERSVNKIWAQYKKGGKQEAGRPRRYETKEGPSL